MLNEDFLPGWPSVNIDVFTLFPGWFDWFREQRHVRNALALGPHARVRRPARHHAAQGRPGRRHALRRRRRHGACGWTWSRRRSRRRYGAAPPPGRRWSPWPPGAASFDDALAAELAGERELTLLCGRYEGFDERVHEHLATDVVSIGPYVLAGGELAAMVRLRRRAAQAAGRARPRGERGRGVVQRGARGRARVPALHAAGRLARARACPRCCCRATTRRIREWRLRAQPRPRERGATEAPWRPPGLRYHCRHARQPPGGRASSMSGVIESLERAQLRRVPAFQAGDRVRVHFQVVEGTRRRTQVFEGVVIKRQGNGVRETFTVRKQSFGVGVERTFPLHSPKIEKIEVAARGDVRRAKLYYLRDRVGRARARARAPLDRRRAGGRVRGGRDAPGRRSARRRGGARRRHGGRRAGRGDNGAPAAEGEAPADADGRRPRRSCRTTAPRPPPRLRARSPLTSPPRSRASSPPAR